MCFKKLFSRLLLGAILYTARSGSAMQPEDPARGINYREAFDQTEIHKKFRDHLVAQGCTSNLYEQTKHQQNESKQSSPAAAAAIEMHAQAPEKECLIDIQPEKSSSDPKAQAAYEQACINNLRAAHRWILTAPARRNLTLLGLFIGAAGVTTYYLGADSFGGSFSVFAVVFNSVHQLRSTMDSLYNLAFPPAHPLNPLEERFAKTQCYIPKALWPMIIEKFMLARQNQFEQRRAMEYIEFALGITTYKPKPELQLTQSKLAQVTSALHSNIDTFFRDYEYRSQKESPAAAKEPVEVKAAAPAKEAIEAPSLSDFCCILKINTDKFIQSLVDNKSPAPRYIYLFGPGGIGKTHFVQKLCSWIEQFLPGSIQFEDLVITAANELEGNEGRPGAFLRVLRNQLLSNKRASVVFMDEATWLNNDGMISPAKRVFNGDQSKLSTTYFGAGVEGAGINLAMPPMLIFCAGNEDIKDKALDSRFDKPRYPLPKQNGTCWACIECCS